LALAEYRLVVEYDDGIDTKKDDKIRKLVGGEFGGGGGCCFPPYTRDLSFIFTSVKAVKSAKAKLMRAKLEGVRCAIDADT
jgi:hypothetical protein